MPTNSNHIVSQKLEAFSSESKLAEFLTSNFTESLKQAIKVTVKIMIKEEMEILRKEFDEKIYFNGSYPRNMLSTLCALGIKADGSRKIIGFQFSRKEDYESWHNLLANIKKRGLSGKNLKLIISDDNQALKKASSQLYPKAPIQTCIVHKMRNVMSKTSSKHKAKLAEDLKLVFNSKDKEEAINRSKQFCKIWYVLEEKAISSFKFDLEYCFTYFDFSKEIWTHIRTTNILEREFRELRRRIKVFDSSFNGEQSCTNYANNIFTTLNKYYPQMNITQ